MLPEFHSAAFSPAFFHITGQKSERRKRVKEKKKRCTELKLWKLLACVKDPESEPLSRLLFLR